MLLINKVNAGNNYYFSTINGDDSRTVIQARNPATPWKTISKLNSVFSSLAAGDSILFKKGETFTGTIIPTLSGTLVSPIIISSFGIGTKPIISGFENISGWISEGAGIYSKIIFPQSIPNMVTINGINTPLGRYPRTGYLTIDSHVTNTTITDADLNSTITNWTGAEVVIRKWNWVIDRSLITNHSGSTITYTSGSTNNAQNGYGYFIQNDLRCLTDLGDWAYKSGKLYMYFGSKNPDSVIVKVSTINKVIDISSRSNITIANLEIQGGNTAGVNVSASSYITITNCDINYSATNAITAIGSSTYLTVSNTKISNSNNKAISLAYGCTYSTIKNNTITKTGLFAGMGNNATISGSSSTMFSAITLSDAHNGLVEYNNITNTGYLGICFYANNVTVNKNYIDTFCSVSDDGGGIYTGVGPYTGRKISNNIIINGVGAPAGTTGTTGDANGIYLDYNASYLEVFNNTVAFCPAAGIYIHNGHDNSVHDNLVYGTANQLQLIQNSIDDQIRNNVFQNNSFINNNLSQTLIKESSAVNDILSFGKFSGNYYVNIFKDERVSYMTYFVSAKYYRKSYSYYRWLSEIDTSGKNSPLTLPLYNINSLIGTNKFTNGTFNTSVTNFSKYYSGTSAVSWDNTNKITAGSAKYSISTLSTDNNESLLSGSVGPVTAGTIYEAKFSLVSTKKNRILRVKLIENLAPYRVASIEQYATFSDTITNHKIQITPSLSLSSAKLYFYVDDDDSDIYIDNIEFYEANATIVNPEDFLRFEYNATNSNSNITLAESYRGIDNTVYSGSLTLLPYTSIILFKTTDTTTNKIPSILNQNFQLNENTPNGTNIGTVIASDPDATQILSYSILSGNTNGAFAINATTGVLSVVNSAALNFESTPSFALIVKVLDNGTAALSSQATVTVSLLDVNEAP
ncbi:MAG: cadherin domain-containing protein, partial [Bacteroidales bacterium]|nr:cadherin domain-containing protein [Bacteroidales bacterium]